MWMGAGARARARAQAQAQALAVHSAIDLLMPANVIEWGCRELVLRRRI